MNGPTRTDWIWIRHAAVQGQEARYYGQLDVASDPINPLAAAAIGRHLPAVAVWLATPLSRTRQTALALKSGVDPIAIADFTEQDFGMWQGRSHNDVYSVNRSLDWNNSASIRPPEGESFADVSARVAEAIERLSTHYAGHSIVAVAHASTVRAAAAHALKLDANTAMRIEVSPLSVTRLTRRIVGAEVSWNVGCLNSEAVQI